MKICKSEYNGLCKDCLGKKEPNTEYACYEEFDAPEVPNALSNRHSNLEINLEKIE